MKIICAKKRNRNNLMIYGVTGQECKPEDVTGQEIPHIIIHSPIQATFKCKSAG